MNEIGVFETISIENQKAMFLEKHLDRMKNALVKLEINNPNFSIEVSKDSIENYLVKNPMKHGVLKISISNNNIIFSKRENQYSPEDYLRGFVVGYAKIPRDETSIFSYFKSTNNSHNLLEKSRLKEEGIDEPIFLNLKGELAEGAVTNIFFIKDEKIFTPKTECGLLNGIIRSYIIENYEVEETIIMPDQVNSFDEMFLTNSLMGIMPVKKFGDHVFKSNKISKTITSEYLSTFR